MPTGRNDYYKHCPKCVSVQPIANWNKNSARPDGLQTWCRSCLNQSSRDSYQKNVLTRRLWSRRQHYRHVEIPEIVFEQLEQSNEHSCEICGTLAKVVIDHCHATNQYRGLLCQDCNLLLGKAKDSIAILANAIKYLEPDNA